MLKRIAIMLLISMLFSLASGCWSRKEIETLAFVTLLGLDKEGQDTVVTVQIALPQSSAEGAGGGGTESPVWTVTSRGRNTAEAVSNMTSVTGKRIYLPHVRAFIIGEELAKSGLDDSMDFLNRSSDLRGTHWLAIAKGRASDLMKVQPKLTTMPAFYIDEMFRNINETTTAPPVNWLQFTRNNVSSMKAGNYAPGIKVFNVEEGRPEGSRDQTANGEGQAGEGQESAGKNEEPGEALRLEGVAVFKDNRLIGWLNDEEAQGLNWIRGELNRSVVILEDSKLGPGSLTKLTTYSKRKIRVTPEGDSVKIDVYISQEGNLLEVTLPAKVSVPERIELVNKEVSNVIKKQVEQTLTKLQKEFKADITTISEQVRAQQPDIAKRLDWAKEFPNVKINVHVDANVRRTGSNLIPTYIKSR